MHNYLLGWFSYCCEICFDKESFLHNGWWPWSLVARLSCSSTTALAARCENVIPINPSYPTSTDFDMNFLVTKKSSNVNFHLFLLWSCAMSLAANFLKRLYVDRTPESNKSVHIYSSALKATLTWNNIRVLQVCAPQHDCFIFSQEFFSQVRMWLPFIGVSRSLWRARFENRKPHWDSESWVWCPEHLWGR